MGGRLMCREASREAIWTQTPSCLPAAAPALGGHKMRARLNQPTGYCQFAIVCVARAGGGKKNGRALRGIGADKRGAKLAKPAASEQESVPEARGRRLCWVEHMEGQLGCNGERERRANGVRRARSAVARNAGPSLSGREVVNKQASGGGYR